MTGWFSLTSFPLRGCRAGRLRKKDPLPTPQELPAERQLYAGELEAVAQKLLSKDYFFKPIF